MPARYPAIRSGRLQRMTISRRVFQQKSNQEIPERVSLLRPALPVTLAAWLIRAARQGGPP